jgi:hypothetical protein
VTPQPRDLPVLHCKRIVEPGRQLRELGFATDEDAATCLGRRLIGRRKLEREILAQDRLMQLAERFTGLDAELVDERSTRVLVGGRSGRARKAAVRASARAAGTRERELPIRRPALPAAVREVGVESLLETRESQLLEAGDLGLREPPLRELGERGRAPQRERVVRLPSA